MLQIIYEDRDLIVVAKESGMPVHPSPGHETGAVTDELLARYPEMSHVGGAGRPGVVHRLDIETSGVMVFARTQAAYLNLRRQFELHVDVRKTYLAVLHGAPREKTGTLDNLIGRKPWDSRRMAVDVPGGQRAVTHWTVLGRSGSLAIVRFDIETGRTHQIRVEAAYLGHPVVGDGLYGDAAKDARLRNRPQRLLLHSVELSFLHPATGRRVAYVAPPPREIVYAN